MAATSPWQRHVARWRDCRRCHLHNCRTNVVLARGALPADILFIGEAPGEFEDTLGLPLVGQAGKILDNDVHPLGFIQMAFPSHVEMAEDGSTEHTVLDVRVCFTNIVACIPRDDEWQKVSKPDPVELQACLPRLAELVEMCQPRLAVCVGVGAAKWVRVQRAGLGNLADVKVLDLIHPAAILRMNAAQQGLAIKRCVVQLATAYQEVFGA